VTTPLQNSLVRIREATPTDIPFIISLERESPTAAHWSEQQYSDLFTATQSRPQRLVLVAVDSQYGGVVGFLVARHLAPEWELENIVVSLSARRMGVGKRLLERLLDEARETHSASVFLEVRESNAAARSLYEKLGFRETGRRKSYYTSPLEDAILYSIDLNPTSG
jgi:[ribosomal protein S18]-alanine N-acetyltransferase